MRRPAARKPMTPKERVRLGLSFLSPRQRLNEIKRRIGRGDTVAALNDAGFSAEEIARASAERVIARRYVRKR